MNTLEISETIFACTQKLATANLTVREVVDPSEIERVISLVGKPYLTPVMNPENNDFTVKNAFWLIAEIDGKPAMIGGARLDDLGGEAISSYWRRSLRRQYRGLGDADVSGFSDIMQRDVSGRVAYFGDLFVVSGSGISRRQQLNLRWFTAIGHALTALKWSPDWTYAFIREVDVMRGAAPSYGFSRVVPAPQVWGAEPPEPRSNAEWCALLPRSDLPGMLAAVKGAAIKVV
jgi:hypothetical protein